MRCLTALLVIFITLSACTPKSPESRNADSPEPEQRASLSLEKTDKQEEKSQEKEEKKTDAEWSEFTGPVELQKQNPRSYILPESFLIGPLSDSLSLRMEERSIVSLAGDFWNDFRAGKSLTTLLAAYPHPLFLEELEQFSALGGEITAVEKGRPVLEGNSGRMHCLVCSDRGCLEGTLYLIREEDTWFIEDWEIPFRDWPGRDIGREEDVVAPPANW